MSSLTQQYSEDFSLGLNSITVSKIKRYHSYLPSLALSQGISLICSRHLWSLIPKALSMRSVVSHARWVPAALFSLLSWPKASFS